jgi:ADP-ribose pyrophosphatase
MDETGRKVDVIEKRNVFQGYHRVDAYRLRHSLYRGGIGAEIHREVIDRGQAILVVPYDPVRDEIVLIEQFRMGPFVRGDQPWSLEVVAGMVDDGETLEDVVRREAREEADIELSHITHVMDCYTSPGILSERISIFCACTDATRANGIHGLAAEGEDIKVIVMAFDEVIAAMADGRITAAPAIVGIQWLALNRDAVRQHWSA